MEKVEQPGITEARLNQIAEEASNTNKMLYGWAQKQATAIIKKMEAQRHGHTLSLQWPNIRQGWIGGFISGVSAGFQLGYQTANKMNPTLLDQTDAVLAGGEAEAIEARNGEIRKLFGEAVGEASMCWSETPPSIFDSAKAEAIVNRLMARFGTPIPEPVGQTRLPGV